MRRRSTGDERNCGIPSAAGGKESGKYAYFRTCYQSIADYDGKISHIIGRSYDISTERAVREKLLREVQLDPLTRIYNKTASGEIVDAFLEKSTQGTHVLYVIDIDDFKKINDTFGHTVGDMVISDIATLIREQFTDEAVVGRVGGDEFMVFVKDTSLQEAEAKAEQLCTNVQKTLSGDGAVIVVTLSVGMAVTGKDGYDYSTLFEPGQIMPCITLRKMGKIIMALQERPRKVTVKESTARKKRKTVEIWWRTKNF